MEKRWIPTHSVTPTLTRPSRWRGLRRPVVRHTIRHGGTNVRIFSHTLFTKNNISNIFWAFSEGPRGSTPTFSNPSPNDTHIMIFPRHINKRFYSGTPNLQRHPYTDNIFGFPSSRYLPLHFFPPLSPFLHIHEAVEPYLQRNPYANTTFAFPSPYLPQHFFPPLYRHFNFS